MAISPRLAMRILANIRAGTLLNRPSSRASGRGLASADHARRDGLVRALVDEDERARGAVVGVRVDDQRAGGPQAQAADVVEAQLGRGGLALQRADVQPVDEAVDD